VHRYCCASTRILLGRQWTPTEDSRLLDEYRFTEYFELVVLRKRPYLRREWCIRTLRNAIRSEPQEDDRLRFWPAIPELGRRYS